MLFKNAKNVLIPIGDYWRIYGGFSALICSPYLFASFVFSLACFFYWSGSGSWAQDAIDVIPSILGFSLGGYAIFMAFSDEKFLDLLVDDVPENSFYLNLNAQFVHFIVVQVLAILVSILGKAILPLEKTALTMLLMIFSFVGFWIFIYAIFTALATAVSLLRFGVIYHEFRNSNKPEE